MAAPTRPAPMPQPRPWASAEVVVEAMLEVAARAATARAAILVLIDMDNSIGLRRSVVARVCRLDGAIAVPVRNFGVKFWYVEFMDWITTGYRRVRSFVRSA